MTLESWTAAFVAQLFCVKKTCSSCSISFGFGHIKSLQSALICLYSLWNYQVVGSMKDFSFPLSVQAVQGSSPAGF